MSEPAWSSAVGAADWIAPQLLPFVCGQRDRPGLQLRRRPGQLMAAGTATIRTSRGTIQATLRRPSWRGAGWLETSSTGDNGVNGHGRARLSRGTDAELRDQVCLRLTVELIGLAGS